MSSSSSSCPCAFEGRYAYDVFLSFRGEDTRDSFTSHLYEALKRKQILTFIDDNELSRGEEISPSLLKAIQQSKISLIVFSPNYASSKWCLDELAEMIECKKTNGQIVIPVFYHVDPSHVRNQTGSFADAFAKHEQQLVLQEKLQKWKAALKEAANLSGWDSSVIRRESKLIKNIVVDILAKLNQTSQSQLHPPNLVGIKSHVKNVESLLCLESPKVRSVGIWGMGGIGKTTLARVVFDRICSQFQGCYFVVNVKEELKRGGVTSLWNTLVLKLLGEESLCKGMMSSGVPNSFTKERFCRTKVLIVFDDVDVLALEQLKELLFEQNNLFGPGSKILVTSRDKQVLKNLVDEVYLHDRLNHEEALQLFNLSAFKKEFSLNDQMELSNKVVAYANGNPLAIKVLGSALFDKRKDEWDSVLDKLEEVPKLGIMNILRISYHGLSSNEKKIFLDIVFFFRWENRDCVTKILDNWYSSCGYFIIGNLIDKSLITVTPDNKLDMHDLNQEMGLSIAREESITNENSRRLCNAKDVYNALMQKKGTKAIKGICLDLLKSREMQLGSDAFKGMSGLRFLKFYYNANYYRYYRRSEEGVPHPQHGFRYFPTALSYLHWDGFASTSLPPKFCAENLVVLILRDSKLKQLWEGAQNLVNLQRLDLTDSKYLTEIPNLSKAKNIESILLRRCMSLVTLPSSVQYLEKLKVLDATYCVNLRNLPRKIDSKFLKAFSLQGCGHIRECPEIISEILEELNLNGTAIKKVPISIHDKVKYLRELSLHGLNITKFPELSRDLEQLCLTGTGIEEVPSSIELLTRLHFLELTNNWELLRLPSTFCKLKSLAIVIINNSPKLESFLEIILEPMESLFHLHLRNCNILEICNDMISMLPSLSWLDLSANNFKSLPPNMKQLHDLKCLYLHYCKHLRSLPELPSSLMFLELNDCESLETFATSCTYVNLLKLELRNCLKLDVKAHQEMMSPKCWINKILPGTEIPEWFSHRSTGSSLTIHLPGNGHRVTKIAFCAVIASRKVPSLASIVCTTLSMLNMEYFRFLCKLKFYSGEHDDMLFRIRYQLKDNNGEHDDGQFDVPFPFYDYQLLNSDHLLQWHGANNDYYNKLLDFASKGASIEFELGIMKRFRVKSCGVHLLYNDDDHLSDSGEELGVLNHVLGKVDWRRGISFFFFFFIPFFFFISVLFNTVKLKLREP